MDKTIIFPKDFNQFIESYDIFIRPREVKGAEKELLVNIPHEENSEPIPLTKDYVYNYLGKFELPSNAIATEEYPLVIFVNDMEVSVDNYAYNSKSKILKLFNYTQMSKDDIIKVTYYSNSVKYIHTTDKEYEYSVLSVYKKRQHGLGGHSLLK